MIEEEENSHLDESLRNVFSDFHLPPAQGVWGRIEQRLGDGPAEPPRKRRRPLPLPLLLPLALLLGLVGGWLLPRPGGQHSAAPARLARPVASAQHAGSRTATSAAARPRRGLRAPLLSASSAALAQSRAPQPTATPATRRLAMAPAGGGAPIRPAGITPLPLLGGPDSVRTPQPATRTDEPAVLVRSAADSVPGVVRPLVQLTRASLVQLRDSAAPAEARQVVLVRALRAEKSELLRLQRRVDSLLLALGAVPLANAPAGLAAAPPAPAVDTARSRPLRRWSLLLTATPEQNHQQLQTASTDTLQLLRRNQERGRRGLNAAIMAEYRLDKRLSVGFGLGYQRTGTELRVAERRTDVAVRYDTTLTHTLNVYTSTHQTYSIRLEQIPQLNPVFNPSGQVIRYDTVFITRPDTVYTTIVQNDTVRTTNKTVTPLLDRRTTTTYKTLTPTYHFFTVPVLLRYRLTLADNTRWWADVAAGAQLQLFLGGSQLVTEDGRTFRTERVRIAEGPFRPLNLALSGSIGVNYALTPRLSMSLAPSLRWQALSVYKPGTGLIQRSTATGLQIGARWQF
ncbi:hypothetical protein [Hymenobacter edaphi]|uniref:Outer membrane protein beta-barrel domain-containing protein n=1 Tax=Hymenobacter edaphi TaxID=2211146 RepID=A0A328BTJ3_9BACT|nr:hypothetical protein [Hymenobacter edaphi]RAK68348.1 hypothetical protein DLM85_10015 [Hymenobacter edaphi]